MTAAIAFNAEAFSTTGPQLMGRNAAGESFLRGLISYADTQAFWAMVDTRAEGRVFARRVRAGGRQEPVHIVEHAQLPALSNVGTLFISAPTLAEPAWRRETIGRLGYSLCGVTHTTASAAAMDAITDLVAAPLHSWDALICTSSAVKAHVESLITDQATYLRQRLGATRFPTPQLPIIPLGVHCADFDVSASRDRARAEIGITTDTVVILFLGRLSFHGKANPWPLYTALERIASRLGADKRLMIVECGWHASDGIAQGFAQAAEQLCPSVLRHVLDGRDPAARRTAWAIADIFVSLADNIQETFGIAPLEAMAAGLPTVVSDWDGYRDTVRDGIDGFRIPTLAPPPGSGTDLALRHALGLDSYDRYCGHASLLTAVDPVRAEQALAELVASPDLRQRMGAAGQARARAHFDWSHIIPQYQALWAELGERRAAESVAQPQSIAPGAWPARADPFAGFQHYPTRLLAPTTSLRVVEPGSAVARVAMARALTITGFAPGLLPEEAECAALLAAAGGAAVSAARLVDSVSAPSRRPQLFRALAWLIKIGVLQEVEPASCEAESTS